MLYVHKFIAGWLLPPGGIIVMLFLLCCYCFKKRSRLRYPLTAVTVTLYLFSILPVAGMLMQGLEKQYVPPALEKITGKTDAVVVLGGGAVRDVPDISGREALSAVSMNRLITGLRLQKRLDIPIIISGGAGFYRQWYGSCCGKKSAVRAGRIVTADFDRYQSKKYN